MNSQPKIDIQLIQKSMSSLICTGKLINSFDSEVIEQMIPAGSLKGPADALKVYQEAYIARLTEGLGETFEAVWWILGDRVFFQICESYIRTSPSQSYNLSDFGNTFPSFLEKYVQGKEVPFISDLARFELIFKNIFHQKRHLPTPQSTTTSDRPLHLDSTLHLLHSSYNIFRLWEFRNSDRTIENSDWIKQNYLALYKNHQDNVQVLELLPWQYEIILLLQQKKTISEIFDSEYSGFENLEEKQVSDFFSKIFQEKIVQ